MPTFLRVPYRIALFAFNWLAVLRYRRPFVALGDELAATYLALWSNRGLGLNRDFVKLIRSCALLAYFDHPATRARLDLPHPERRGDRPVAPTQRAVGNGLD